MTGFVADLISVYLVETGPTSLNISIKIYRHAVSHALLSSYLLSCPFFSPPFLLLPAFFTASSAPVIIDHTLCGLVIV